MYPVIAIPYGPRSLELEMYIRTPSPFAVYPHAHSPVSRLSPPGFGYIGLTRHARHQQLSLFIFPFPGSVSTPVPFMSMRSPPPVDVVFVAFLLPISFVRYGLVEIICFSL